MTHFEKSPYEIPQNMTNAPAKRSQHFIVTTYFLLTQHIAALLGATSCARLATLKRHVARCCAMWGKVVDLKMVKFFMQHLWMLHDVFNTQHIATGWANTRNILRPTINVAICCIEMLRSLGRSLQMLGQQCWDMLC